MRDTRHPARNEKYHDPDFRGDDLRAVYPNTPRPRVSRDIVRRVMRRVYAIASGVATHGTGRSTHLAGLTRHALDLPHVLALVRLFERHDLAQRQRAALIMDTHALPVTGA